MPERMIKANGIDIWTEDFGEPAKPALLLVMGATAQGIMWPDEFCRQLAGAGHHVIRYDNRDVGLSTCFDFAEQPYQLADMAKDAAGVLDAYGIAQAHVVGASMGGMIAQTLAIEHPDRVLTMTSIMSSPAGVGIAAVTPGSEIEGGLPGVAPRLLDAMMKNAANPPVTDDDRVEAAVVFWRALAGTADPIDEDAIRARERLALSRARNIGAAQNHTLAIGASPDRQEALRKISVPTLVIHGTDDPILPLAHGKATAECIPGAKFMAIEGMGHDMPVRAIGDIRDAIIEHTRA